mmetsp:Transcript_33990/g.77522  ORF Transcript_33990/g.77522 Transcript_33990/m.77522 type:complete len:205 (+) Transcript_33990:686-1300(+)
MRSASAASSSKICLSSSHLCIFSCDNRTTSSAFVAAVRREISACCNVLVTFFHWKLILDFATLVIFNAASQKCCTSAWPDTARCSRSVASRCFSSTSRAKLCISLWSSCISRMMVRARSVASCSASGSFAFIAMFHVCLAVSIAESADLATVFNCFTCFSTSFTSCLASAAICLASACMPLKDSALSATDRANVNCGKNVKATG